MTFSARLAALPAGPLYTFAGEVEETLDVDGLRAAARVVGARLAGERGRAVLVVVGPGAEHLVGLFGCWEAGACAVAAPPPADDAELGRLAAIAADSGARVLLASPAVAARLAPCLPGLRPVPLTWGGDASPGPGPRDDDPAVLLYTSGSTGAPKGAILRHGGVVENMRLVAMHCRLGPGERVCAWLPHTHIAGLYLRLLPVVLGARGVYLPPAAFLASPLAWVDALSAHRATLTAAPDFAWALVAQLATPARAAGWDLSALKLLVSGGEVVRPATVDRLLAALAPARLDPASLHPYYGLTETTCTAIPQRAPPARRALSRSALERGRVAPPRDAADAQELLGNGPPLPGVEVAVVDPEHGARVASGRVGELWTRGPGVIRAYTGDPAASAPSCAATLADGSGPWFRTGDLGFVDGDVFVTGRLKELIIVRGKNHVPLALEASVHSVTVELGVTAVAAFPVELDGEEALGLAWEGGADAGAVLRAARRALSGRHGLGIAGAWAVPPGTLPRTATRKLARHACARLARDGSWAAWAVGAAPKARPVQDATLLGLAGEALREALTTRILALTGVADPELTLRDAGLDSLDLAGAAAALRRATGVEPPLAAFFDGSSARGLAAHVAEAMTGAGPADEVDGWRDEVGRVADRLPVERPPVREGGAVLLTGGTGFLGAYLLAELLRRGHDVVALVRAGSEAEGLARLERALAGGPGPTPGRLRALPGDLTRPRFGLDEAAWAALEAEVGTIVHNAADVNFVAPYRALRATNVEPVHAIVDLALAGGVARPVHFVSTLAVFNSRRRREQRRLRGTDRVQDPETLYSGYAQTKWVAEAMLRVAGAYALPLAVHRPGLIVGPNATGRGHRADFLSRFVAGCAALGAWPDADVELDLVPVDEVAAGVAARVATVPGPTDALHWTTRRPVPLAELHEATRAAGAPAAVEALPAWLDRIRADLPADNPLFPVHAFLLQRPAGAPLTLLELLDGLPLDVDPSGAEPCSPVDLAPFVRWVLAP